MTHEELEAIEARLKTRCDSLISMDIFAQNVDSDMATLIAEVKRLTRERDAAVEDMRHIAVNNGDDRWYKCNFCTSSCSEELADSYSFHRALFTLCHCSSVIAYLAEELEIDKLSNVRPVSNPHLLNPFRSIVL